MAILRGRLLRPLCTGAKEIEAAARAAGIPCVDRRSGAGLSGTGRAMNCRLCAETGFRSDTTAGALGTKSARGSIALETAAAELYQRALLPDGTLSTKVQVERLAVAQEP